MRSQREKLLDNGVDEDISLIEDEAIHESLVGVTYDSRAVYNITTMIEEFMNHHNLTYEEALEHIECNIIRSLAYMGENAPVLFDPLYL